MKKKNIYVKGRIIKPFVIAGFVVIAGIAALFSSSREDESSNDIVISRDADMTVSEGSNPEASGRETESETAESSEMQESLKPVVYICGEVRTPGLYTCDAESRIADVVAMAGGLMPEADDTCVNMAAKVSDAQQIVITKKGEQAPSNNAGSGGALQAGSGNTQAKGLVNINTADEAALKTLPGIGDQKAKAIISYRENGGSFSKPEDIMNVSGIKDGAYNKIKDLITV